MCHKRDCHRDPSTWRSHNWESDKNNRSCAFRHITNISNLLLHSDSQCLARNNKKKWRERYWRRLATLRKKFLIVPINMLQSASHVLTQTIFEFIRLMRAWPRPGRECFTGKKRSGGNHPEKQHASRRDCAQKLESSNISPKPEAYKYTQMSGPDASVENS